MNRYFYILQGLFFVTLVGMENQNCQLDLCPTRKIRYQAFVHNQDKKKKCPFCDAEILKTNYILREDNATNVREMMNKNPYIPFGQGIHLLMMPISHKEHPADFSCKELMEQSDALSNISAKLHNSAYTQEYFTSWGTLAGQSIPHWHSHFKNYFKPSYSLPEVMSNYEKSVIKNLEEVFKETKIMLESPDIIVPLLSQKTDACLCCKVGNEMTCDDKNLVVARFKYNYICLAHYALHPGDIVIVPQRHVSSITYLLKEELRENLILAMALFPKMREYVQAYIDAECDGGNIYIKNIGGKESVERQEKHHVYTSIISRTSAFFFPGTMDGNSCKLEYNPTHLVAYLKEKLNEIKATLYESF